MYRWYFADNRNLRPLVEDKSLSPVAGALLFDVGLDAFGACNCSPQVITEFHDVLGERVLFHACALGLASTLDNLAPFQGFVECVRLTNVSSIGSSTKGSFSVERSSKFSSYQEGLDYLQKRLL